MTNDELDDRLADALRRWAADRRGLDHKKLLTWDQLQKSERLQWRGELNRLRKMQGCFEG